MICGDEYEQIQITSGAEADLMVCGLGDHVVVRMLDAPLPETLLTEGCRLLIGLDPGGLALGRLTIQQGQLLVTCAAGSYPYDPSTVRGVVVSHF